MEPQCHIKVMVSTSVVYLLLMMQDNANYLC
jgi:hypothetical protein